MGWGGVDYEKKSGEKKKKAVGNKTTNIYTHTHIYIKKNVIYFHEYYIPR